MSFAPLLMAAVLASPSAPHPTPDLDVASRQVQTQAQARTQTEPGDSPVQLEDIEVRGRQLQDLVRDFVNEVAEPNAYRGLARWDSQICVGVANLKGEAAQYLADRISTIAEDLDLRPGAPGCTPNLLIVATSDGNGMAETLVGERRRAFRMGGAGMDRGGAALQDFVETDRAVRWWQMSLPVDSNTGAPAVRISGECRNDCESVNDIAPQIKLDSASRLRTQIVDRIIRTIVIVDVDQVSQLSINQLADYIAMVSLAQINPDSDTSGYASILNVFSQPDYTDRLTDWDQAYLGGLYNAERNRLNRRANRSEISDSIMRAHAQVTAGRDDEQNAVQD